MWNFFKNLTLADLRTSIDWFLSQTGRNIAIILLTGFIIYQHFQINELNTKINDLESIQVKNIELEKRLNAISGEILIFKAAGDDLPIAKWTKDLHGKIIYINNAFLNKYLRPRGLSYSDYVGKYDSNVFPTDYQQYASNDSLVIAFDRPIMFLENEGKRRVKVLKYPYKINGVVIGVNGIEYDEFKP